MGAQEAVVKKAARAVFARHRVQSQMLNMQYNKGRLFIRGKVLPLGEKPLSPEEFRKLLIICEDELESLQGVNSVGFDIYDWEKVGNDWKGKA